MQKKIMNDIGVYKYELVSKNVLQDFHIMRSSKIFITSNSTFSLMAALTSNALEFIIMPKILKDKFRNIESSNLPIKFL